MGKQLLAPRPGCEDTVEVFQGSAFRATPDCFGIRPARQKYFNNEIMSHAFSRA
jgi:hypothetical protein